MKSFIFMSGFFTSFIFLCQCEELLIMTYHPRVVDHYLEISRFEEQRSQKTFKRWYNDVKLSVCKKLINPWISFHVLNEAENYKFGSVSYSVDNLLTRLQFLYDVGEIEDINYTVVVTKVRNSLRDIAAHLCITDESYQAAIASAYHDNTYFYLDKTDKMNSFCLTGVAEPQGSVNPIINYNSELLKSTYLDNLIRSLDNEEYLTSLCSLSQHKRFRVCSIAYVSLMRHQDQKVDRKYIMRTKKAGVCVRQAKILLNLIDKSHYIVTDLISCTVETLSSETTSFYLTANPKERDSAFIVSEVHWSPSYPVLIGDFSGRNKYNVDFKGIQMIAKEVQKIYNFDVKGMKSSKGRYYTSEEESKAHDNYPERGLNEFYSLDMVIEKLTPLFDF